jgi:acylphosphatase
MHTLLNSQASRNELNSFVNTYDDGNPVYTNVAMKEADFNTLYRDIQNRFGIGAKMSALSNTFADANYYFTTTQAKQLIQLVSSESNRLELAKASYDNIVDQVNFSQLYTIFSNSSRNELELYVRDHQDGRVNTSPVYTRTPMSNSNYTSLYNEVRNTYGFGAKMSRLTEIFATETFYFIVTQAKQLIQLVSAESNRLELAKSSYGNITDRENFNLMYDVLSNQSSKNELSNYVNTYSYTR